MIDLGFKYKSTIEYLIKEAPFKPEMAIVLGSGLGNFADSTNKVKTILTSDIPGYPSTSVEGHKGLIHFATIEQKKTLIFQGRLHFYEGYKLSDCVLPVLLAKNVGCNKILFTNAAGGVNKNFSPANLMLVDSFNSINIKKELSQLINLTSIELKNKFLHYPSERMNRIIRNAAKEKNIFLQKGIYWYNKGPTYETPAEIMMIEKFGGDAAGMSTVHEAVFAASLNMDVAIISCITNMGSGISKKKLSHEEVTQTANEVAEKFTLLLKTAIPEL